MGWKKELSDAVAKLNFSDQKKLTEGLQVISEIYSNLETEEKQDFLEAYKEAKEGLNNSIVEMNYSLLEQLAQYRNRRGDN